MIRVKATKRGYYAGVIREPGDEFEIKDKSKMGSWMQIIPGQEAIAPAQVAQPVQVTEAPTPAPVTEPPGQTLGEVNQKVLDQQSNPDFLG